MPRPPPLGARRLLRLRRARLRPRPRHRNGRPADQLRRNRLPPTPSRRRRLWQQWLPPRANRLRLPLPALLRPPRRGCPRPMCPRRGDSSPPVAKSPHAPSCRPSVPRHVSTSRRLGGRLPPMRPNRACLRLLPACRRRRGRPMAAPYRHRRLRPDRDPASRSRRPRGHRARPHAPAAPTGLGRPAVSVDRPPAAATVRVAVRPQRRAGPILAPAQAVPADPPEAAQAARAAALREVEADRAVVVAVSAKNCSLSSSRPTPQSMRLFRRARSSSSAAPRPKTSHCG